MTALEFHDLPQSGLVDPSRIRTIQSSASPNFRSEGQKPARRVADTIADLRSGRTQPVEIPPVRIFEKDGKVYSLDHRRLVSAREAGVPVHYSKARNKDVEDEYARKYSTEDDGMSIKF